mgnify:CR=1 FL=1
MEERRYLARSWSLLTQSKGWMKPVLVLTAANYVPLVGSIGVDGFALEWARLTAWGIDAAPKQQKVDVTGCLVSGMRALVVSMALSILVGIPIGVLRGVSSAMEGGIGGFVSLVVSIVAFVVTLLSGAVIMVAKLRVAIYEKMRAGFSITTMYQMICLDPQGFIHMLGISLLCGMISGVAIVAVFIVLAMMLVPTVLSLSYASNVEVLRALAGLSIPLMVATMFLSFVVSMLGVIFNLVQYNAMALWVRRFNVPAWGAPDDPLPE